MRALLLAGALALPLSTDAQETHQDERISRDEAEVVEQAFEPPARDPIDIVSWTQAELRGGYSARRLIGTPVRDSDGGAIGKVRDLLVNALGTVTALVVGTSELAGAREFRVPWHQARIAAAAKQVSVPVAAASAGATQGIKRIFPRVGEWRMSEFLDDAVQLRPGVRYGDVDDLIITAWGEVRAIVVDPDHANGSGRYAYPWGLPYDRTHIRNLRPFDYDALNIAAPP